MALPNLSERLEDLAHGVLGPLVLGGPMRLAPPFGPQVGFVLGADGRRIVDDDLRSRLDVARVRRARTLAPIDVLPDVSPAEWSLVAALNDLLQATNHLLSGALTRGRHGKVLEGVSRLLDAVKTPRTTLEMIVRHATFARVLEVTRTDTTVSWWVGSTSFRGEQPSKRLTAWPSVRRVEVSAAKVPLAQMHEGIVVPVGERYLAGVARLLSQSPLTDIATVDREAPAFAWSKSTLELVSYPEGRTLALRTVTSQNVQRALSALHAANARIREGTPLRALVDGFAQEIVGRLTAGQPAQKA
jgi:hypothetical protein